MSVCWNLSITERFVYVTDIEVDVFKHQLEWYRVYSTSLILETSFLYMKEAMIMKSRRKDFNHL